MFRSITNRPIALAAGIIAVVVLAIIIFFRPSHQNLNVPPELADIVNTDLRKISNVTLMDQNKNAFTSGNLSGKWSFIIFGYTNCPDVCPTTLMEIDDLALLLKDNTGKSKNIQYIFVSIDPKRDTPEELKSYLAYFDAGYLGVTGSEAALRKLTDQVGVKFSYTQLTDDKYAVNHSSHMVLIDPKGRYVAHFPAPVYAKDIRDWFTKIRTLTL